MWLILLIVRAECPKSGRISPGIRSRSPAGCFAGVRAARLGGGVDAGRGINSYTMEEGAWIPKGVERKEFIPITETGATRAER